MPENMDGTDLMPLYEDPTADVHETIALINVWGHPPPTRLPSSRKT